jgi:hypothetical protein
MLWTLTAITLITTARTSAISQEILIRRRPVASRTILKNALVALFIGLILAESSKIYFSSVRQAKPVQTPNAYIHALRMPQNDASVILFIILILAEIRGLFTSNALPAKPVLAARAAI